MILSSNSLPLVMKVVKIPKVKKDMVKEEWWCSNDERTSLLQTYIAQVQLWTHQQMWIEFVNSFPL